MKVCVLGAGCVGLSTALQLQTKIPNARVRVIADRFNSHTTSTGAAGIFIPSMAAHQDSPPDRVREWAESSFSQYTRLLHSEEAALAGVILSNGYVLYEEPREEQNPLYSKLVFSFNRLTKEERTNLNIPDRYSYSYNVTTVVIEQKRYLPWLMKRFRENGGEVETRHIGRLDELIGKFDVVVNCSALGNRELLGDQSVYPVRGQILRVRAPWVKHFLYMDHQTYIIPGIEAVVLGGVSEKDKYDLEEDPVQTEQILQRCQAAMPSLKYLKRESLTEYLKLSVKGAEIDHVWVGLRPQRDAIRLEQEVMTFPKGQLKVVHNYGHGFNGVALSWGTATEAAELTKQFLLKSLIKL